MKLTASMPFIRQQAARRTYRPVPCRRARAAGCVVVGGGSPRSSGEEMRTRPRTPYFLLVVPSLSRLSLLGSFHMGSVLGKGEPMRGCGVTTSAGELAGQVPGPWARLGSCAHIHQRRAHPRPACRDANAYATSCANFKGQKPLSGAIRERHC